MNIVWDIKKATANIKNHGIEFSHGATVLDDPMAVTIEDTLHGEQRFVTVGAVLWVGFWLLSTLIQGKRKSD